MASRGYFELELAERRGEQNCTADFIFRVAVTNGGEEEPSTGKVPSVEAARCGRFRPGVKATTGGGVGV
jgi:hypothetical protein